eukprot:883502_1
MDQLIRFRALSAELSTDELKLFVCKLIDNGQREPIISGIFNNLHKQIKHNKDLSIVQTINENIQNIIQNRNVDTDNNTSNISNKSQHSNDSNDDNGKGDLGPVLMIDILI